MANDLFELEENYKKRRDIFPDKKTKKDRFRNILYRRVPILEWFPRYNKVTAVADLIAGVSLGLTLIPQSIAYASLANLTAQYGLYSSFMGKLCKYEYHVVVCTFCSVIGIIRGDLEP